MELAPLTNWPLNLERPVLLGWDIAGIVVSVGEKVTHFEVGDAVFGMINFAGRGNGEKPLV